MFILILAVFIPHCTSSVRSTFYLLRGKKSNLGKSESSIIEHVPLRCEGWPSSDSGSFSNHGQVNCVIMQKKKKICMCETLQVNSLKHDEVECAGLSSTIVCVSEFYRVT